MGEGHRDSLKGTLWKCRIISLLSVFLGLAYIAAAGGRILRIHSFPAAFGDDFPNGYAISSSLVFLAAVFLSLSVVSLRREQSSEADAADLDPGSCYMRTYLHKLWLRAAAIASSFTAYLVSSDLSFCIALGMITVFIVLADFPTCGKARAAARRAAFAAQSR